MRTALARGLVLVAIAAVLFGFWRWWASDERALARELAELVDAVEKSGQESELERFAKARQFTLRFADPFTASARPYEGTIEDRQQLAGVLDRYRSSAERIEASSSDRETEIRSNGTAEMFVTIALTASRSAVDVFSATGGGRERLRVHLAWIRVNGSWKIRQAEVLEQLEGTIFSN